MLRLRIMSSTATIFCSLLFSPSTIDAGNRTEQANGNRNESTNSVCDTQACKNAAKKILERINTSTDPCDDFYQHACGKWIQNHEILDNETLVDEFYYLQKKLEKIGLLDNVTKDPFPSEVKIKHLYRQCKDEDHIERQSGTPVLDFLNKHMGGWPVLTDEWNASNFDIFNALVNVHFAGSSPFFEIIVDYDVVSPLTNVIYITEPATFAGVDILNNEITGKLHIESYLQQLMNVTTLLLQETNKSHVDVNQLSPNLTDIVATEKYLAMAGLSAMDAQNDSIYLNKMTLSEFYQRNQFNSSLMKNMTEYMQAYFKEANITGIIHNDTVVVVPNLSLWSKLDAKFAEFEQQGAEGMKRVANYIGWRGIQHALRYLSLNYRRTQAEYEQKTTGRKVKEEPPAGERCLDIATESMPLTMGALFVRDTVPKDLKEKATLMVNDIQMGFKELLDAASWMDNATHNAAQKKLSAMINEAAYPDIMVNNISLIDSKYANIAIQKSYAASMMEIAKNLIVRNLKLTLKANLRYDPVKDTGDITEVNTFYSSNMNGLIINAAILQPPFYDPESPEYYNYGGIGVLIGHETTHGFDNTGGNYDDQGVRRSWWTNSTKAAYDIRTKGLAAQYDNYTTAVGRMNGQLTLAKNIADNGGTRAAYKGYLRHLSRLRKPEPVAAELAHYSPKQLFFLSLAQVWCEKARPEAKRINLLTDEHSPAEWRVNGVVSNMVEFSEAFNCSVGARMNPRDKQTVW
ncbi:membrane metallo-endopeptidase-like 1 isoform X2 [Paramacrobiotus metropolitanus]|uniref:membrane metallo-endopeptidase-like 1 isoform X2 n=1 Tax=Paramacrobiotus metropolitanus TaxID=2943436 RepID=UPI002446370C|nr:membrane metallo-endopeptidase-like 1 isoform X2 [Paramacrobiotus metropolitanus]